jgi:hypothetical protein
MEKAGSTPKERQLTYSNKLKGQTSTNKREDVAVDIAVAIAVAVAVAVAIAML